jgi:hypothetical protein
MDLKPYTVLLLRPDYVANEFGKDTYQAWVTAESVNAAQSAAQLEAFGTDNPDHDPSEEFSSTGAPEDYAVLTVIYGHQKDIKEIDETGW